MIFKPPLFEPANNKVKIVVEVFYLFHKVNDILYFLKVSWWKIFARVAIGHNVKVRESDCEFKGFLLIF